MSMPPTCSMSACSLCGASSLVTSRTWVNTCEGDVCRSVSSSWARRPATPTFHPWAMYILATSRPMPEVAPIIMIFLFIYFTLSIACCKSAMMSFASSIPTDKRIKSGATPASINCSSVSCLCV